jgi:hypothetical protein
MLYFSALVFPYLASFLAHKIFDAASHIDSIASPASKKEDAFLMGTVIYVPRESLTDVAWDRIECANFHLFFLETC